MGARVCSYAGWPTFLMSRDQPLLSFCDVLHGKRLVQLALFFAFYS